MDKKKILIAMVEVGEGHKTPALAIREGLEHLFPDRFQIDVLDFEKAVGNTGFDRAHKANWNWMLRHPRTTTLLQTLVDEVVPVVLSRGVQALLLARHARDAGRFVIDQGYDLLVCTHFFSLQSLAMARKRFRLAQPLVGVHTDVFEGHALWAERAMDELIVTTEQTRRFLRRRGVPDDRMRVFGYPVRLKFLDAGRDQAKARQALGLDPSRFTVLHTAGGEGLGGQLEAFVDGVMAADLDVQYVVICGRNRALLDRLAARAHGHAGRTTLLPQGFVDNMPEWIVASDLVVGKGGPGMTMESLLLGRPIFHTSYASRLERRVIDFCVANDIGAFLPQPGKLVAELDALRQDRQRLEEISRKIAALPLEQGTLRIAEHLAGMLGVSRA